MIKEEEKEISSSFSSSFVDHLDQGAHARLLGLLLREDDEEQRESQVSDGRNRGASTRTPTSPPGDHPQSRHSPASKPEVIVTHFRRRRQDERARPVLRAGGRTNAHASSSSYAGANTPFANGPAATSNSFTNGPSASSNSFANGPALAEDSTGVARRSTTSHERAAARVLSLSPIDCCIFFHFCRHARREAFVPVSVRRRELQGPGNGSARGLSRLLWRCLTEGSVTAARVFSLSPIDCCVFLFSSSRPP